MIAAPVRVPSQYQPHERQVEAHATPQRWTLYGGAWRGGKTRWGVEEIIDLMVRQPGLETLIGRYDYSHLMEPTQAYDEFHKACPPQLIKEEYRSAPAWTRLTNGSRVTWTGLKDYKPGAAFGAILVDQAEEVPEAILRQLNGRLVQVLPDGSFPFYRMLLTDNPHPRMEWYFRMVEQYPSDFAFVRALPSDNPYIPGDYIEQQKRALTPDDFKRYIEGSRDTFEGMAVPEFDKDIHIIDAMGPWVEEHWPVWRGIDWGLNHPTVCEWVTRSPDGDLFFAQEYAMAGETPTASAKAIVMLSLGHRHMGTWFDPRMKQVKAALDTDPSWSIFDAFVKAGVYGKLSTHTRLQRYAAWREGLRLDPERRHFLTHQPPAPRVYIMRSCERLIWELPRLERSALMGAEDVVKIDDDGYDAGSFVLANLLQSGPVGKQAPPIVGVIRAR